MSAIDWGDFPTWAGAIFAAGAAAAAVWTLASQRTQIKEQREFIAVQSATLALERAELRAAAEERRWQQAKTVVMTTFFQTHNADGGQSAHWDVRVRNDSDSPIKDILVKFGEAYNASNAREITAASMPGEGLRTVPVALLGPGRELQFVSGMWPTASAESRRPLLTFTDAAGLRWRTDEHNSLSEE